MDHSHSFCWTNKRTILKAEYRVQLASDRAIIIDFGNEISLKIHQQVYVLYCDLIKQTILDAEKNVSKDDSENDKLNIEWESMSVDNASFN